MITPELSKEVAKGNATVETFVYGGSGAGTIPVPNNKFIIITKFDWFNFIDIPEPSGGQSGRNYVEIESVITPNIQFDISYISILPTATVVFTGNTLADMASLQNALDIVYPGSTIYSFSGYTGTGYTFEVASVPGDVLSNGQILTISNLQPATAVLSRNIQFFGATPGVVTIQDILNKKNKMLEFRSLKSRNSFAIVQNVEAGITLDSEFNILPAINVKGIYQKDCYLVHEADVSINIWTIPASEDWGGTFSALPNKSGQAPAPNGYGVAPVPPGVENFMEILFDGPGGVEQYIPVGIDKVDTALTPILNSRQQFRPDITESRKLENPTTPLPTGIIFTGNRFPLINIEYVQFDKPYNYFLKSSN